jgi:hypothetical protein
MARISRITSRKLGAFSQRDMVGQVAPAVGQVTAGQLEGRITPQMIEVVGIFVAAGWNYPGFVESCGLGIRLAVGVSSCPPVA